MGKDVGWKVFFSDDARLADFINGVGCGGEQVVTKEDLHDLDTQVWLLRGTKLGKSISAWKRGSVKIRDMIRKVAFGVNFAIIGVENQENLDYSIPMKSMAYDVGTYEMQASKIRKEVRKDHTNLSTGEYLYGFRKESKLLPTVTFILYTGEKEWDGPMSLHDMFDFIRCASDSKALKELVEHDDYYKHMDEEAFDVAVQYTKARELIEAKEYLEEDGGFDMCKGLTDLIAEALEEDEETIEKLIEEHLK